MDFRQLRTFVHVAQLGSISLAAERLNIAQSALTRQIQSLESELKVILLRRHGRGVTLTPAGEILQERAGVILQEIEQTRQLLKSDQETLSGSVSFGMPPSVADVLSGALIEKFTRLHPQVRLRAVAASSGYVYDWLQRGTIDIGVIYDVRPASMLKTSPLMLEHLYLVERAQDCVREGATVTLAEALARDLILPSRHHGLRLLLDGVAAANGLTFDPVSETDSMQVQLDLVRRGLGATILPLLSVKAGIEAGAYKAFEIVSPNVTRKMVLARALDRPISAAAQRFCEVIEAEVANRFPRLEPFAT